MKTTKQVLVEARALISEESKWTKGEEARDANGTPVLGHNPDAVCFCALGATFAALPPKSFFAPVGPGEVAREQLALTAGKILGRPWDLLCPLGVVGDFNDDESTTHADVLALFDLTIERLTEWYSVEKLLP